MQRTRWKTVVALATIVAALASIGGTAAPAEGRADGPAATKATIKVGVVYSRTGLLSAYGAQYIQGLRLGLEYARQNRLLGGNTIQLTTVDDGTDPAKAVAAFRDLAGQGFKIIAGSVSSGVALQLAPLAEQNRVLYLSGPAASDAITGANRYTFRSGRQTLQDVLAVKEILGQAARAGASSSSRRTPRSARGTSRPSATSSAGRATPSRPSSCRCSANDFTPFAQQAKTARPDLLFVAWAGTTAPAMWRALEQQGVMSDVTVATGLAERATWGSYAPGINFLSHYTYASPKNKVNTWLVDRMKKLNQLPDLFHPDGFNAALMLARAISQGGGTDVDRMISSLEGCQFVGPKGVNRIRQQDHALLQPMFHVRLRQVGSRYVAVPVKSFSPGNLLPPVTPFKVSRRRVGAPLLITRELGLDIGGATIVADVDLEVAEGEFLGIIGPNGAGRPRCSICSRASTGRRPDAWSWTGARSRTTPRTGARNRARPHVPDLERLPAAVRARERAACRRGAPRGHDAGLEEGRPVP